MKTPTLALTAALCLPALGVLPACESFSRQSAPAAAPTLATAESLEAQLDRTDAAVVSSLDALDRLRGDGVDEGAAYAHYTTQVSAVQEQQRALADSEADFAEESAAYLEGWTADAQRIPDADLRRTALDRKGEIEEMLGAVDERHAQARRDLEAYTTELAGIQTYLRNDLTPEGIDAIGAQLDDAQGKGEAARSSLRAMEEDLLRVTDMADDEARGVNTSR